MHGITRTGHSRFDFVSDGHRQPIHDPVITSECPTPYKWNGGCSRKHMFVYEHHCHHNNSGQSVKTAYPFTHFKIAALPQYTAFEYCLLLRTEDWNAFVGFLIILFLIISLKLVQVIPLLF